MFTVENINVEDEYQLARQGWTRRSFPAFRDDDGLISVSGWTKGPFGVFTREFIDDDAGRISAASLIHLRSCIRLGVFADLDSAAEGAEIAEPLANWDEMIAGAASRQEAQDQIDDVLTGRWMDFSPGQLFSPEGFWVLYHA
jgi:hypothetical protein